MTYTLTIPTGEDRDLVVTALRTVADQRTRVARRAATEVITERGTGKDARGGAVKVTALLHEANQLVILADALADAADETPAKPVKAPAKPRRARKTAASTPPPSADEGDGTSREAQRLAELAGLEPADPDADPMLPEDPETNELPEDRAGPVEDVAALALVDDGVAT